MSLYSALYVFFQTDAQVNSFVGDQAFKRIFDGVIPQRPQGNLQLMPAIVYARRGVQRARTYCASDQLVVSSVVLDCYATAYRQAFELGQAVKTALMDYRGLLNDTLRCRDAALQTEIDLSELEPGLFRISQTWSIWHQE